jgi:HEAT repeat protein
MADSTLRRIVQLITSDSSLERRRAAIVVAAEVGLGDAALAKALLSAVEDSDPAIRLPAIEALGKLRAEAALSRLAELVRQGGPELEAAAQAAGCLGTRGAKAIERIMHQVTPVQRRRIAAALAHGDTDSAAVVAAHALLDDDPGVVAAAARSLAAEVPTLPPSRRKALASYLVSSLKGKSARKLPAASEAGMLRVLAALHDPKAEDILWSRLKPQCPAAVRATALQALGGLGLPKGDARTQQLLECALDPDFQVAAPAMLLLQSVPVTAKALPRWLKLLDAPDAASRKFAVEKLGSLDSAAVAKGLVAQLSHNDHQLRDAALEALRKSKHGRRALVDALLEAPTAEQAWTLARAQAPEAKELPTAFRQRLFATACSYHQEEDRRADALFFLLRECDPAWTRDRIEERGLALRKKKDYAGAVGFLRLLARDPGCSEETRFELAATGLKIANHDLAPEARHAEPSLAQFGRLLQDPSFDLTRRLTKAKFLDPDDLFYLGFHFAEQNRREKEFGGQVLEMLVKRSPNSNRAKDAKRKLKSEGLA